MYQKFHMDWIQPQPAKKMVVVHAQFLDTCIFLQTFDGHGDII